MTPSKPLAAPQPLNIAFPLGNGGVLRSEEGGGFGRRGTVGRGKKEGKKDAQKVLRFYVACFPLKKNCPHGSLGS